MSLVRLNGVSVKFSNTPVLREAFFRLEPGDRVGLIGKNGSGKSTLLKLVLDQLPPTEGTVSVQDGVKIGYFSQFSELDGSRSVLEVLAEVFASVHVVEAELATIETAMGDEATNADELDRLVERQAALFEEMERLDGWDVDRRIDTALTKLGFNEAHRSCPIDALSGGWRNRASLAKILLEKPDILLFDEPTNYLDVAGVEWVESWFGNFHGAAIVVSHDRAFLDGVVNRIVEVENHHLYEYTGNFAAYIIEKQLRFKTLQKQFVHEEELLAYEAEGIANRREAARNKGKNLGKRLARIRKSKGPRPVDQILTEIYGGLHTKDRLCEVRGLHKAYDDLLFSNLSFDIRRKQRLAILGPNGSGKSTLLRVLTGLEEADQGTVEWTRGQSFVSYNQMLDELDPNDTVTHAVNALPGSLALTATRKAVSRFLTMFQFSEADMKARISTLSGGEKARVAMAQCLLSGASALVLDEPTNHLDMTSAQVMERALAHFPGAVVVVSHDRFFIDKVATHHVVFGAEGAAPGELRVHGA